jgi:neutral ceramidase
MRGTILLFILCLSMPSIRTYASATNGIGWKAGVARAVITPEEPIWMAGFTSRTHPATGKLQDLWVKVLALEDVYKKQVVLITTDLEEIPRAMSDRIRNQLKASFNLSRAQIILNCSHTHSSPIVKDITGFYTRDPDQLAKVKKYSDKLEAAIVSAVARALHSLQPAELFSENGVVRFQVNRRNNAESKLWFQTEFNGPNDYAVPVLKVINHQNELLAIVFGYACHNSVLSGYEWSGDYAGYAQIELEKMHPGATALFFQGAGGNQIAYPRKSVASALYHGKTLASAVERVLSENMFQLTSKITAAYSEIDLPISKPPAIDSLLKLSETVPENDESRWARLLIDSSHGGKMLRSSYPYPVQVWRLGQQTIFSLGGEVVVEYALHLKSIFGQNVFVAAYCNDVMEYIPTSAIINEGGYEGAASITSSSGCLPAPWAVNIEPLIIGKVLALAKQAGVPLYAPGKPPVK